MNAFVFKPVEERPTPKIQVEKLKYIEKWSLFVVVNDFVGGSHKNYDVVFNSQCSGQYFDSILDASLHANNLLAKHEHDNLNQYNGLIQK